MVKQCHCNLCALLVFLAKEMIKGPAGKTYLGA